MHIVRILLIPILVTLLFLLSSAGVVITAVAQTATNRDQVKTIFAQRSIYDSLRFAITEGSLFDFEADQDKSEAPIDETKQADIEALQKIIDRYFTVDFYNRATNTLVNSFYDWFEGKTARPEFTIAIAQDKAEFQHFIADTLAARYSSLPPCPPGAVIDENFNPLEASCQAPEYSASQIQAFINQQADQPEFQQLFENASLNSDSLTSDISDQDSRNLQSGFKVLSNLSWLLPLLLVLTAGLIVLILYNRNRGFKTVAFTILPPALVLLVFSLLGKGIVSSQIRRIADNGSASAEDPVDSLLTEVLGRVYSTVNNRVILISAALVLLAAIMLGVNFWLNKREGARSVLKQV